MSSPGAGNTYQVAVAGLQGLVDGLTDLAGGRLPGAESQLAVRALAMSSQEGVN